MQVDIPLNAVVECRDGQCGRTTHVVLYPGARAVTHVVVEESRFLHPEHLVPLALIADSTLTRVRLRCTRAELRTIEPFVEVEYLAANRDLPPDPFGRPARFEVIPEIGMLLAERERIPPGELAVHRYARVCAIDGPVGRVDEFLTQAANGRITHLVLRRGHLWGRRDVPISVFQIARIESDCVHLRLAKGEIEALPCTRA